MESNPEQEYLDHKRKSIEFPLSLIQTLLEDLWEQAYEAGYEYGFDSGWDEGVLDYKGERKFL